MFSCVGYQSDREMTYDFTPIIEEEYILDVAEHFAMGELVTRLPITMSARWLPNIAK